MGPLARGYLLWFERREKPSYAASAGLGLLLIFIVLEFIVGPRASILSLLGIAPPPAWARIAALLLVAVLAVRFLTGAKLEEVGFVPSSRWRAAERLYLAQVLLIAGGVFLTLHITRPEPAGPAASWAPLAIGVGTAMLWGFYQEVVYRGILQTELSRRFGAIFGGLVANLAFTFGPLHFYHMANMQSPANTAVMMSAIFGIGLLFSFIYARTRNIWLVGIMHGVGDVFTNGAGGGPQG